MDRGYLRHKTTKNENFKQVLHWLLNGCAGTVRKSGFLLSLLLKVFSVLNMGFIISSYLYAHDNGGCVTEWSNKSCVVFPILGEIIVKFLSQQYPGDKSSDTIRY